jgi:quercetin dioxygenase-like cupin family protein
VTVHVARAGAGIPFTPAPDHHGVSPVRLHGGEAGPTDHLVIGRSSFAPGAKVDPGPVAADTVYVVLDGGLQLVVGDEPIALSTGDSVHLPAGTVRGIRADSGPATILVVRAS